MTKKRSINRRPRDVLTIDEKISELEMHSKGIRLFFEEAVDMTVFCSEYMIKFSRLINDTLTGFWAEHLRCLTHQVEDEDEISIIVPCELLKPGDIVYVYTLHETSTYGTEFEITKAAY